MRKFNFNSLGNTDAKESPDFFQKETEQKPKHHYGAYRTVMSRHSNISEKLKSEPVAEIKDGL